MKGTETDAPSPYVEAAFQAAVVLSLSVMIVSVIMEVAASKKKKKKSEKRRVEDRSKEAPLLRSIAALEKSAAEVKAAAGQLGDLVRARLGWHGDALDDPRWIVPVAHMAAAGHLVRAPGAPAYAFAFRDARDPHSEEEEEEGDAPRDLVLGVSSWKSDDVFHLGRPRADTKWQWEELPRLRSALRRAGARVGHVLVQCAPDELGAAADAVEHLADTPVLLGWESASSEQRMLVLVGSRPVVPVGKAARPLILSERKAPGKAAHKKQKRQNKTENEEHKAQRPAEAAAGPLTAETLMPPLYKEYRHHRGPRAVLPAGRLVAALLQSDLYRDAYAPAAPLPTPHGPMQSHAAVFSPPAAAASSSSSSSSLAAFAFSPPSSRF